MSSEKQSNQSNEASGPQENDSVFDFLYHDAGRIASFLSQFDPFGHLTQITNNARAHRSKKETSSSQVAGSVALAKANITGGTETSKEVGQQTSRSYDPRWANALAFLDFLEQRNLLRRDVDTARIGDIVLAAGDLSLFDLSILQKMWDLPTIKKMIVAGAKQASSVETPSPAGAQMNRKDRRRLEAAKRDQPSETEMSLELLSVLPHAVQAAVSNDDRSIWCTLKEDSITVSPADLFMKHGLTIGGKWVAVGILDAMPDDEDYLSPDGGPSLNTLKQMLAGAKLGYFGFAVAPSLVHPVRQMLGRPSASYGITPLLLFREVSPRVVQANQ